MIALYYLGFTILLAVVGPLLLLFKKKARIGLKQKLGFVPRRIQPPPSVGVQSKRIWFHTVSVGEFNATHQLIALFQQQHPDWQIFVSTTTGTGQALAQEKVGDWATVFYFPYDTPWAINNWLDRVQPDVVAIAETEIWPGFVHECVKRHIKLCLVNGRISPRSFEHYKIYAPFISSTFGSFTKIAAQSEQEAFRYRSLGAGPGVVQICGNMKFDGMRAATSEQRDELRRKLQIQQNDTVLVAGSTHEGEESALLEALTKLVARKKNGDGNIRLIIAPRHPERFQRAYQVVESYGFRARCFSRDEAFERENDVYVLDTIGQLMKFYSLATIAFVGGTIARIGGHNIVEPCIYEVPVVCGPHVQKTRDVASALKETGGIVQIERAEDLFQVLSDLIWSPDKRMRVGAAGKYFLDNSQGAVGRTISVLNAAIAGEPAPDSDLVSTGQESCVS
jgi:3-deoxy-D-manno-octulosonic-acid transferase